VQAAREPPEEEKTMDEQCRECGTVIAERLEGDAICLPCATRLVYAASRNPALVASGDERQALRELAHAAWVGDGWSDGALAVAEGMLAQIRDVGAGADADADEAPPQWYCGGCGDELSAETTAAWHGGSAYCRGCEEAPAEDADAE